MMRYLEIKGMAYLPPNPFLVLGSSSQRPPLQPSLPPTPLALPEESPPWRGTSLPTSAPWRPPLPLQHSLRWRGPSDGRQGRAPPWLASLRLDPLPSVAFPLPPWT